MEKIAVTGLGVKTPYGQKNETWQYFCGQGRTEIPSNMLIDSLDLSYFPNYNNIRRMDRMTQIAFLALDEAIKDSNLDMNAINHERIGAVIGTSYGPVNTVSDYLKKIINGGIKQSNPSLFPNTVLNAVLGQLSIQYKLKGFSSMVVGGNSIVYASDRLRENKADILCVGGIDEFSPIIEEYFIRKGANKNYRLSEGASFIILEKISHAEKRNAKIYCEINDYSTYTDIDYPFNPVSVDRGVLKTAILDAIKNGKNGIDCIISLFGEHDNETEFEKEVVSGFFGIDPSGFRIEKIKDKFGESFSNSEILASFFGAMLFDYDNKNRNVLVNSINNNGSITSIFLKKYEK
jgi:3-oxoacyl-[acyl-carrier-protein] synthase II